MSLNTKTLTLFGGWSGSLILLLVLAVTEMGSYAVGGDWGAFLYVTFHFILIPLFALLVLVATGIKTYRIERQLPRVVNVLAVIVPLTILYITISGSTWLMDLLRIDFNR